MEGAIVWVQINFTNWKAMTMGKKLFWADEAESVFSLLQGALERNKSPIAVISISPLDGLAKIQDDEIISFIRNSDLVFHDPEKDGWWAVLPNSGKREVIAFLKRLEKHFEVDEHAQYRVLFTEVRDPEVKLLTIVKAFKSHTPSLEANKAEFVDGKWVKGVKSTIRVSLIVNEPIVMEVLKRSITTMKLSNFDLDLQTYEDGLAFETSEWYTSAHTHLVILDDVLPKKNGIEIVHFLRNLPSNQKFHIFMLTDRVSEENLINAYQMGIDEVIQKPFNLRLFEALFRRTIERLWFE